MVDKNIGRDNGVRKRGHHLVAVVHEVDGDVDRIFRHGYEKYILERFLLSLRLVVAKPFLEERREGVAVDDVFRAMLHHDDLSVAFNGYFREMLAFTIPSWQATEFIHIDVLTVGIPREGVVQSQGVGGEKLVEVLRMHVDGEEQEEGCCKTIAYRTKIA